MVCLWSSGRLWSVCEVVVVPYVVAVVAVTVMHALLFVLHVCMLRVCDGARLTAMLVWGMDVGGTRGSGIVSSAVDVLLMSVVRGMRGVGGVCEMSMCLARDSVGGEGSEWMRGLGLGFTNPVGAGGLLDVCVFWLWCCGWRRCGVGSGLGPGSGGVRWYYVCVRCESGLSV